MIRRCCCLLVLVLAGGAPLVAQSDSMARARPVVGCWAVSVGKYAPKPAETGSDTADLYPARKIQIDTTAGQGLFEHYTRGWLVHAAYPMSPTLWRGSLTLGPSDSLDISWPGGTTSLDARVKLSHDTARGTITRWYDYGGPMPVAPVTLVRSSCR